ncbi:neuropeptides capa receptor-like [Lytechinus variegatus]|uniref:neuropeptides capa receptor-like n=1 Tax=Lytechinus variegatus TaxID=7654 RepID=UPI001BB15301|nr:neuropeptides capa receptor-like [Lytechinus variegatus]XP_041459709.1 neuropeptides capa receptor-like [Lytechinus variegatus]
MQQIFMSSEEHLVLRKENILHNTFTMSEGGVCPPGVGVYDIRNYSVAEADTFLYQPGEVVLITIVMPIIWAIGAISNIAFIFVVARIRRMRTVTNYYLLNLALADIMFLCFAVGDKVGRYAASPIYNDQYGLKTVGCVLLNYFVQLSYYASIFLVTLVTLEKYYAVCRPVQHRLISGRKRTIRTVAAAWLLATAFALSLIPGWFKWTPLCFLWPDDEKYESLPNLSGYCLPISDIFLSIGNGLQTIPFFVVMILNFLMYGLIIRAVNTRVAVRENQLASTAVRSIQMRNQVVRMLIVNGVIFFICLAPYQCSSFAMMITSATENYVLSGDQVEKVMWTGRILSYVNSAINPFVYTFVNPRYRHAFFEAFAFCPSIKRHLVKKAKMEENGSSNISMDQSATIKRTQSRKESTATTDSQISQIDTAPVVAHDVAI